MLPVAERIHLYKNGELVTFASLTEEEKKEVRAEVTERLIDSYMTGLGYKRVSKTNKKGE